MSKLEIVSYVPALHQGYIEFLEKHPGNLNILGDDFIGQVPRLERDIRAVSPEKIKLALGSLGVADLVEVLTESNIDAFKNRAQDILMPDDEVNRQFAGEHLNDMDVEFEPAFLRWNWQESTAKNEVISDTTISELEFDKRIMSLAFKEAENSPDWWRQVGGVLVKDDEIIYKAYNAPYPDPDYTLNAFGDPRSNFNAGEHIEASKALHTEMGIIARAAKEGVALDGSQLYVTTFPCPVCARAIAESGISRIYFSEGYSRLDAADLFKAKKIDVIQVVSEKRSSNG